MIEFLQKGGNYQMSKDLVKLRVKIVRLRRGGEKPKI